MTTNKMHSKIFPQFDAWTQVTYKDICSGYTDDKYTYGGFLEQRRQSIHLGLDINVPIHAKQGITISSPCSCTVIDVFKDTEVTHGWGGRLIFKLETSFNNCDYMIFGHLSQKSLPNVGTYFKEGDIVGQLGQINDADSGTYFPHIHVQLLTSRFYNMWKDDLENLDGYSHDLTEDVSTLVGDPTWLCFNE